MNKKDRRTDLFIKNMVCSRCIRVIEEELKNLGHEVFDVQLGKVVLGGKLNIESKSRIKDMLDKNGFALLEDKNARIVEAIKTTIIDLIYGNHLEDVLTNLSDYLSSKLGKDYSSLSKLFPLVTGITVEQFFILHKIERVKELLVYDELTLSEISWHLGYSSVQHLSSQFKKVTGYSPRFFKGLKIHRRSLDKV